MVDRTRIGLGTRRGRGAALLATVVASALLGVGVARTGAQGPTPTVDMTSLLNTRFYPQRGAFFVEHVAVAFLPPSVDRAQAVFLRDGQPVVTLPLRHEAASAGQVWSYLEPNGVPGVVELGQPGSYVYAIEVDGRRLTELPFSMTRADSGDPFAPAPTFSVEGPWRQLALLGVDLRESSPIQKAGVWTSGTDVGQERARTRLVIRQGARELARTPEMIVTGTHWRLYDQQFRTGADDRGVLRPGELRDGRYALALVADGRDVREWPFTVEGGKPRPIARGVLGHQPPTEALLPRGLWAYGGDAREHELVWLEAPSAAGGRRGR